MLDFMNETPIDILNKEADCFARNLLMPEKMVRDFWPKAKASAWWERNTPIDCMATIFAVEKTEMARRLAELDLI